MVQKTPLCKKTTTHKKLIPIEEVGRLVSQLLSNHGGKINMNQFNATKYTEEVIELSRAKDLVDLFKCIESEENFIITWVEAGVAKSKVVIGTDLLAKVKNGDLELRSQEPAN